MKVLKVILIVLACLVGAFVVTYCMYACSEVNSAIDVNLLFDSIFYDTSNTSYIYIGSTLEDLFFKVDSMYYFPDNTDYVDNVFICNCFGEEYYFEACSTNKLYSLSFRCYFYRLEDNNVV